jgi:hypothetical protein
VKRAFVAAASCVALAAPAAAAAKDGLLFDRASARVGETVVASSPWNAHPHGLVLYLVPLAASPRFWPTYQALSPASGPPPAVPGAVRLGRAGAGGHAARLAFRVPRVAPGRYVLGIWCIPCDAHWTTALPNFQPAPRGILRVRR